MSIDRETLKAAHSAKLAKLGKQRGKARKFSVEQLEELRERYTNDDTLTLESLAEENEVSVVTMSNAIFGKKSYEDTLA